MYRRGSSLRLVNESSDFLNELSKGIRFDHSAISDAEWDIWGDDVDGSHLQLILYRGGSGKYTLVITDQMLTVLLNASQSMVVDYLSSAYPSVKGRFNYQAYKPVIVVPRHESYSVSDQLGLLLSELSRGLDLNYELMEDFLPQVRYDIWRNGGSPRGRYFVLYGYASSSGLVYELEDGEGEVVLKTLDPSRISKYVARYFV